MKQVITSIIALPCALCALAQTEAQDSIKTKELGEVVVEAQMQRTSATVSSYIPTSKQKNSSQTATDLLNRMAIPQLSPGMGNSVKTNTGKAVNIYIDYLLHPSRTSQACGWLMSKSWNIMTIPKILAFKEVRMSLISLCRSMSMAAISKPPLMSFSFPIQVSSTFTPSSSIKK